MATAASLPQDCLIRIAHFAAAPEAPAGDGEGPAAAAEGAAPGSGARANPFLQLLLVVGGVCRGWRAATITARFDAVLTWQELRGFASKVGRAAKQPAGSTKHSRHTLVSKRCTPQDARTTHRECWLHCSATFLLTCDCLILSHAWHA